MVTGDTAVISRLCAGGRNVLQIGDSIITGWGPQIPRFAPGLASQMNGLYLNAAHKWLCSYAAVGNGLGAVTGVTGAASSASGGHMTGGLSGIADLGMSWYEVRFDNSASIGGASNWYTNRLFQSYVPSEASGMYSGSSRWLYGASGVKVRLHYYRHPNGIDGLRVWAVAPTGEYPTLSSSTTTINTRGDAGHQFVELDVPAGTWTTGAFLSLTVTPPAAGATGDGGVFIPLGVTFYNPTVTGTGWGSIAVGGTQVDDYLSNGLNSRTIYMDDAAYAGIITAAAANTVILAIGINNYSVYTHSALRDKIIAIIDKVRLAVPSMDVIVCTYYHLPEVFSTFVASPEQVWIRGAGGLSTSGYSWNSATKTLSKTGQFNNITPATSEWIQIRGGTGVTPGWYRIQSKPSADAIVLYASIGSGTPSDVTVGGIGNIWNATATERWGWQLALNDAILEIPSLRTGVAVVDLEDSCGSPQVVAATILSDGTHPINPGGQYIVAEAFGKAMATTAQYVTDQAAVSARAAYHLASDPTPPLGQAGTLPAADVLARSGGTMLKRVGIAGVG